MDGLKITPIGGTLSSDGLPPSELTSSICLPQVTLEQGISVHERDIQLVSDSVHLSVIEKSTDIFPDVKHLRINVFGDESSYQPIFRMYPNLQCLDICIEKEIKTNDEIESAVSQLLEHKEIDRLQKVTINQLDKLESLALLNPFGLEKACPCLLGQCSKLRYLEIYFSEERSFSLFQGLEGLPACLKGLVISNICIEEATLNRILKPCNQLEMVCLEDCIKVSGSNFEPLPASVNIVDLSSSPYLTAEGINRLLAYCGKTIKELSFKECSKVDRSLLIKLPERFNLCY